MDYLGVYKLSYEILLPHSTICWKQTDIAEQGNMASLLFFILSAVVLSGSVQSKEDLKPFSKKVKGMLSDETFNNLFSIDYDNVAEFKKAIQRSFDEFGKAAGVKIPASITDELAKEASKEMNITPEQLFQVFINAVYSFLKKEGLISSQNTDKLAKSLAHNLKNAEKSLNDEEFTDTFPALLVGIAKFFDSLGLEGKQSILQDYAKAIVSAVRNL